ncbi:uncharacterized protein LOC143030008 [Oratosquilla oratoria]|uniref:uncharacterized protein LOC143030008 n=1 Tax=Oratosquilla oratoria TaxID=337810 RepID=UPI003F75D010
MKTRIEELKNLSRQLEEEAGEAIRQWDSCDITGDIKEHIETAYSRMLDSHMRAISSINQRKLVTLNGGQLKHPRPLKGYTNLTSKTLTTDQEELLNMGLNCHIMKPPSKYEKRLECEILIDDRHIEAAKQLRSDPNITIRRADKTAAYVLIETDEYLQKLDQILGDTSKFKKITKDPTESLKKKLNQLIDNVNATKGGTKLHKLSGDYGLGYCYGNVKTHKPGNKLRPIISQIPTPSYHIAKKLGEILTPYVPASYSVKSPTDFLDLLANTSSKGTIASLDVENLFTNISVDRTIQFIINRVYHNNDTPNCDIPEPVMKKLLECCTKGGNKYCQIDGVAMGSPLGVLFAIFFMGSIEEEVFDEVQRPRIYCRYIDDIFVMTENIQ